MKGWPRDKDRTVQVSLVNSGKEVLPKLPLGRNTQVTNIKMVNHFQVLCCQNQDLPIVSSTYLDFSTETLCVYRIDTKGRNTGANPTATICASKNNAHVRIYCCLLPTLVTVRSQPALDRIS